MMMMMMMMMMDIYRAWELTGGNIKPSATESLKFGKVGIKWNATVPGRC
jgi:hypothetical protein